MEGPTAVVTFVPESETVPPYRIVNHSSETLLFYQKGVVSGLGPGPDPAKDSLAPGQSVPYAWDDPLGVRVLVVEVMGEALTMEYPLDTIRTYRPERVRGEYHLQAEVEPDGPTRVLRLRPDDAHVRSKKEGEEDGDPFASLAAGACETQLVVGLEEVAAAVFSESLEEVLFLALRGLAFDHRSGRAATCAELTAQYIQVDNMKPTARFPVVVYPATVLPSSSPPAAAEGAPSPAAVPWLTVRLAKSLRFPSVSYFTYASILMQEVFLKLDDDVVLSAVRLLPWPEAPAGGGPEPPPAAARDRRLYFEFLQIHPIKVNFSYASSPVHTESDLASTVIRTLVLNNVKDIDGATIRLNGFELRHAFDAPEHFVAQIKRHYVWQGTREAYKLLASLDILGAPMGLFNNVSTGVRDFFYEPVQGLNRGAPDEIAAGVLKGTVSLVRHSVSALFESTGKLSGAAGKTLAQLTLDNDFAAQHLVRRSAAPSPMGLREGLAQGAADLGQGVVGGLAGVMQSTVRGAAEGGLVGLVAGLGRGVLGALVKPTVGVLDLASRTSEGIRNFVVRREEPRRLHAPGALAARFFPPTAAWHAGQAPELQPLPALQPPDPDLD